MAPTPSGYLHIGNAASFLLTAALAKQAGASLLLRIDDMDRDRVRKEYVEDIFDTLRFLEIDWQEGARDYPDYEKFYSQHHRIYLYEEALQQLREEQKVYACLCSRKDLAAKSCRCVEQNISLDAQGASWRLHTDSSLLLSFKELSGRVYTDRLPDSMDAFVVRKKDGLPAYQLTSLIDDEHFGIDAIVRGSDLYHSTLAQLYLAKVLRKTFFSDVLFYYHPLITDDNGKLSKSAGATSIQQMHKEGKSKDDILRIINDYTSKNLNHEFDTFSNQQFPVL